MPLAGYMSIRCSIFFTFLFVCIFVSFFLFISLYFSKFTNMIFIKFINNLLSTHCVDICLLTRVKLCYFHFSLVRLIFSRFQVHHRDATKSDFFFSVASPSPSRNWVQVCFLSCKSTTESQLNPTFYSVSSASTIATRSKFF